MKLKSTYKQGEFWKTSIEYSLSLASLKNLFKKKKFLLLKISVPTMMARLGMGIWKATRQFVLAMGLDSMCALEKR